ncbi:division/cell wall cluster transcriptional repressor MraZ [Gordonia paraffinivorans]|uniref:Transcriptional regulator MraZ n=2 Tax=Gordonia paraffinivorans TaxID=175628 RepID=A0ABQ0ILX4_9ACTN|nr:division/cell wall cluster transcriptional repressor MraZ [Gordonia paraffinivorans]MBY4572022.1 division/cell wall cluster transcriptional repressor MraZ [Gordonia paraffinivorans]MCD2144079.1 division/cell wall cluster transcriptional repressor MraZ [Gordonia paraffinivorans]PWD43870.1 division/cell wall cluster transcriptional repressor MraZ [Gordonia paraffinivorans]VFA82845.1 cell division protein MraZ [Gordonia paraffinivorans]GAC84393.1 protein MraZ [Gordonia paraffinivorans NBRC 108
MSSVRFVGEYRPKLDDKGRLTLPARFRDDLAGGLVVTKGQDHSLSVYRTEEFDAIAARIVEASRSNPDLRAFQRTFFAGSEEQRPDGQGRIVLSAAHRTYAGLSKECVVFGAYDHVEIWDSAAWDEYQARHEEDFSAANSAALNAVL